MATSVTELDIHAMVTPQCVAQDNHLLVVFKPCGVPSQGDKTGDTSILDFCRDHLRASCGKKQNIYLGLVHRLDRPAGGLMVLAKTSKAAARLSEQFRTRRIGKWYLAWVEGWPKQMDTLTHYIVRSAGNRVIAHADTADKSVAARLVYHVLQRTSRNSLLCINLLTGRKHQIRAQLSSIGHPILGDTKYGGRRSRCGRSIALLASQIEFEHPISKQRLRYSLSAHSIERWNFSAETNFGNK